jgi:Fe-S-cluster containining protein
MSSKHKLHGGSPDGGTTQRVQTYAKRQPTNRKERRARDAQIRARAPERERQRKEQIQTRKVRLPLVAEQQHRAMDEAVIDGLAREAPPITCTKGCSACCKMLLLMTYGEALLVTQKMPEAVAKAWPGIEAQLAKADQVLTREVFDPIENPDALEQASTDWWRLQLDCPFLADGLCSIYEHRPNACRQHFVLSPPERCAVPEPDAEVLGWRAPALGRVIGEHWTAEARLQKGQTIMGPLPHMMELARRTMERVVEAEGGSK